LGLGLGLDPNPNLALSLLQLVVLASFDPTGLLGSLLLGAVELGVSKEVLDVRT